jgi:hypothetical protein
MEMELQQVVAQTLHFDIAALVVIDLDRVAVVEDVDVARLIGESDVRQVALREFSNIISSIVSSVA